MKRPIRALLYSLVALFIVAPFATSHAQSQRGQPTTAFAAADLGKLRWLEGTWIGTAPGASTMYERYHFANDSTIEVTYYADSTFSRAAGAGRVYLTVGRIYYTFGPSRWGATKVSENGIFFIPQVNARNTFAWAFKSSDTWTATQRTGASGRERVTIHAMKRVK